jgi:sugar O-acyltransferase (sialic acid O-acetyltransferase NeuD family)
MTQAEQVVIVGAGGFGREVLGYIQDATVAMVLGFVDENRHALDGFDVPVGVLGGLDEIAITDDTRFVIAVGDPAARRRLALAVRARGGRLSTVVHPTAHLAAGVRLGDGCVICPFAFAGAAASIGANTVLNTYASVGHDTAVGEHCVLSPYATVNGQSVIGDEVFFGTHATVTPRCHVGQRSKISAGAVVHGDVPAFALAAGTPARARVLYAATVTH